MSGVGQTGQIGDGQSCLLFISGRQDDVNERTCADWIESKEDVVMAEAPVAVQMHREEQARRYDPEAVFTLDLNSDSEDE